MADRTKRLLSQEADGIKLEIKIEFDSALNVNHLITKAHAYLNWAAAPDQLKLDLAPGAQVVFIGPSLNVDKPGKGVAQCSFGVVAKKVSMADRSTLYNLYQAGKPVKIVVREVLDVKKLDAAVH